MRAARRKGRRVEWSLSEGGARWSPIFQRRFTCLKFAPHVHRQGGGAASHAYILQAGPFTAAKCLAAL
jgi:hypothetical protein